MLPGEQVAKLFDGAPPARRHENLAEPIVVAP